MKILDNELDLLEKIYSAEKASSRLTQRELAQSSGLSLGMTNAIIRRFEEDGLIRLTRHSTKSISYSLTAEGLAAISQRAATYIRKATHNVDLYRERLASFIAKKKGEGALTLVLSGASELSPPPRDGLRGMRPRPREERRSREGPGPGKETRGHPPLRRGGKTGRPRRRLALIHHRGQSA